MYAGCCGRKDELDREDAVGDSFDAERLLSSAEEVGPLEIALKHYKICWSNSIQVRLQKFLYNAGSGGDQGCHCCEGTECGADDSKSSSGMDINGCESESIQAEFCLQDGQKFVQHTTCCSE